MTASNWATLLWKLGYRVFRMGGAKKGEDGELLCNCGNKECDAYFKHPPPNWEYTPVWSQEQFDIILKSDQFKTGFGIVVAGSLFVIDVSADGEASYKKLIKKIPEVATSKFIVKTGSGGRHLYFRLTDKIPLHKELKALPGIKFISTGSFIVGPGSLHQTGNKYEVLSGDIQNINLPPSKLLDLLKKKDHHRVKVNGHELDVTIQQIKDLLNYINPNCEHSEWIKCGMSIHHATGGDGLNIWNEWSSKRGKYPGSEKLSDIWEKFNKTQNPCNFETIMLLAEKNGCEIPNKLKPQIEFVDKGDDFLPVDIENIDLRRPPGFCGDICQWINDQCKFPRENLSAMASIFTISCLGGLRYIDDMSSVTANLFLFCIAGSSSGKEAILTSVKSLLASGGVGNAIYAAPKSQQEIIRNLMRNQANYYIMDEVFELFKKILNAQKSGGSAYLEEIISTFMSVYSKASTGFSVNGDLKEQIVKEYMREIADAEKSGDYSPEKIKKIKEEMEAFIDNGIVKPFLSFIGFMIPENFAKITTRDQALNGFLGRSLVSDEKDTNPRPKAEFDEQEQHYEVPERIKNALIGIYTGDCSEEKKNKYKVEYRGKRIKIQSTQDARELLKKIENWVFDYADEIKEANGLEAIVRRSNEMIRKISLNLAIPSGIRTVEHVKWAFALIYRDIKEKINIVLSEEMQENAVAAKILRLIDDKHIESRAVIVNKCRPAKSEEIDLALKYLIENGRIELIQEPHKRIKGKIVEKYGAKGYKKDIYP